MAKVEHKFPNERDLSHKENVLLTIIWLINNL